MRVMHNCASDKANGDINFLKPVGAIIHVSSYNNVCARRLVRHVHSSGCFELPSVMFNCYRVIGVIYIALLYKLLRYSSGIVMNDTTEA
jgi:hypothetical protein